MCPTRVRGGMEHRTAHAGLARLTLGWRCERRPSRHDQPDVRLNSLGQGIVINFRHTLGTSCCGSDRKRIIRDGHDRTGSATGEGQTFGNLQFVTRDHAAFSPCDVGQASLDAYLEVIRNTYSNPRKK